MTVSAEQRASVLADLARGLSLAKAMRAADVPSSGSWWDAMRIDPSLSDDYAQARARGYEARADELLDKASDEAIEPASRRIIVDTMKWELSKMLPKLYGDKLDHTLSGPNGGPIETAWTVTLQRPAQLAAPAAPAAPDAEPGTT